jgi:peptidoglycan/xylan/chitin deacetylase (PgdA/CDA1 family)
LTTLSFTEVKKDLTKCHNFIEKTYGVDARPYFRAPFGTLNSGVINAAAEIGYTQPVAWSGSLVDTQNQLTRRLLYHAENSFQDRGIVLSHANNLVVSRNFDALMEVINARNLSLVTLNDVF